MNKVAMFVTNPCTHDARVMKEAKSLADNGYEVRVFALANAHSPAGIFVQCNYTVQRLTVTSIFTHIQNLSSKIWHILLMPFYFLLISVIWAFTRILFPIWRAILYGPSPHPNTHDSSKKLFDFSIYNVRYFRAIINLWLRKNFTFTIRRRVWKVFRILITTPLRAYKRLIFIIFLPLHKITTYYFFCKQASKRAIGWSPNIVHAHDLNTMFAAKIVKDASACKLIYDSHELWIHRNRVNRKARLEKLVDELVERWLIQYADGIITVCDSIGEWLTSKYDSIPEPVILRNMPSSLKANRSKFPSDLKQRLGIPNDTFVMIYTGKLTSGRGIQIGLDVLKEIPNLHFVLLGYGDNSYIDFLNKKILEYGVSSRVSFCDAVAHDEVIHFMVGADFSLVYIEPVCLSYEYALPNKLFESIQANIPIVGSNMVEIKRIVEGYNIGLCFDSTEDLIDKIKHEINKTNIEAWRTSLKQCSSKLCWEVEENQLLDLYHCLLKNEEDPRVNN